MLKKIWEKKKKQNNSDNMIIPAYIVAYFLTLIFKELRISVE